MFFWISFIHLGIMLYFSFDIDNGPKAAEYIQVCFIISHHLIHYVFFYLFWFVMLFCF